MNTFITIDVALSLGFQPTFETKYIYSNISYFQCLFNERIIKPFLINKSSKPNLN